MLASDTISHMGKLILFLICSLIWIPMGLAQDDGGGDNDKFELGLLGYLILPSGVPEADEVYPSIGPHFGLPVSFGTIELQGIVGFARDSDSLLGRTNMLIYVPLAARFDLLDRGIPAYALMGIHGIYYSTISPNDKITKGTSFGINFGGGLIFKDRALRYRMDFRVYARPGWSITVGFVGFFGV